MNVGKTRWSRRYQMVLRKHLKQGPKSSLRPATRLGRQAAALGLETLDVARIHANALAALETFDRRGGRSRHADRFFFEAITPIEKTHRAALQANRRVRNVTAALVRRTAGLATSQRRLTLQIAQRKSAEKALKKSGEHYARLLRESHDLQEHLRRLTHQILSAREQERKRVSRELYDEIAQTLSGINVQLTTLKRQAAVNVRGLQKKIAAAQRMVEKSVDIVHRFARELRPPVLDDLGLIPALHSFVKRFAKRTGVRARLTVFAQVERLDSVRRTVLYRVAQEALTNVARHARASRVDVGIRQLPGAVCMEIKDNGKAFLVNRVLRAKGNHHLGLLGMRERVEMVGGSFSVESLKGTGTTIRAQIPFRNGRSRRGRAREPV